jgi:hypothetical protein
MGQKIFNRLKIGEQFPIRGQPKTLLAVGFGLVRIERWTPDISRVERRLREHGNPGKDSQAGFNIHLMALSIPVSELGGEMQSVGVYATTSRRQVTVLDHDGVHDRDDDRVTFGPYVQLGRQGNPLFNEALVAVVDKDLYSRNSPTQDKALFSKYALTPELAHLLNVLVFGGHGPAPEANRTDTHVHARGMHTEQLADRRKNFASPVERRWCRGGFAHR